MDPRESLRLIVERRRGTYSRELRASQVYEHLRQLSIDEIRTRATKVVGRQLAFRLSRQQLTALLIEEEVGQ